MVHTIHARGVNEALYEGLHYIMRSGSSSDSRNGRVLVSPVPVVTEYHKPNERVLISAIRDANPFFHLMESLWMLAGRNDVAFPAYYASNIASFSDDGVTIAGAYGERWRSRFGYDQLQMIIDELKANPDSRRCVLAMWDSEYNLNEDGTDQTGDLHLAMNGGKDVPCNTHVYFDTLGGKLNITVCCRSNDIVWGCYGANAVHFSVLHEYVALCTGIKQGVYRQFSNNYHLYMDRPDVKRLFDNFGGVLNELGETNTFYNAINPVTPWPLITLGQETWDADLKIFFSQWKEGQIMSGDDFADPFWRGVVVPLVNAHHMYKIKAYDLALINAGECIADDWCIAAKQWIQRRKDKSEEVAA